jgi:hypothetical protein
MISKKKMENGFNILGRSNVPIHSRRLREIN